MATATAIDSSSYLHECETPQNIFRSANHHRDVVVQRIETSVQNYVIQVRHAVRRHAVGRTFQKVVPEKKQKNITTRGSQVFTLLSENTGLYKQQKIDQAPGLFRS